MSRLKIRPRRAIGEFPGGWVVRRVTRQDLQELAAEMPEEWCVADPAGYAVERDGELVATGQVTFDQHHRAWAWLNKKCPVPAAIMHRCALRMLGFLREVDEPCIYIICDLATPGAERWARRLGFVPDEMLTHPLGPVYRCDISV